MNGSQSRRTFAGQMLANGQRDLVPQLDIELHLRTA